MRITTDVNTGNETRRQQLLASEVRHDENKTYYYSDIRSCFSDTLSAICHSALLASALFCGLLAHSLAAADNRQQRHTYADLSTNAYPSPPASHSPAHCWQSMRRLLPAAQPRQATASLISRDSCASGVISPRNATSSVCGLENR